MTNVPERDDPTSGDADANETSATNYLADSLLESSNDERSLGMPPYYVYELRDPRTGSAFYVGKGKGRRMDSHSAGEDTQKARRINEIEQAECSVQRVVVGRFETEAEAFAVETVLIKWVYGRSSLSNLVHGHRHNFVRPFEEKSLAAFTILAGLDEKKRDRRIFDGKFSERQREMIQRNGILEKLDALRARLQQVEGFDKLTFDEVDLSDPQNPGFSIAGFSEVVCLHLDMQLTGERVKIGLNPISNSKRNAFAHALKSIREPFAIKDGRYARADEFTKRSESGIMHEDVEEIIVCIRRTFKRLAEVV